MKAHITLALLTTLTLLTSCSFIDEQGICVHVNDWNMSQTGLATGDLRVAKCQQITVVDTTITVSNVSNVTNNSITSTPFTVN